jgi:uncharacterized protein YbcI
VESDPGSGALTGGQLNAAIARSVVRTRSNYVGRGPTKARSFYRDNVVIVIMQDAMTRAEASLVASGREESVLEVRRSLRAVMKPDLVAAVEALTGHEVVALLSADHIDPDLVVDVFVLDGPLGAAPLGL